MRRFYTLLVFGLLISTKLVFAQQLPDSCKLQFGTNLGGISDYMTELPFVDLMHSCRTWYTKSVGDPNFPFNSGFADSLNYRSDGYPTHIPQQVNGSAYLQKTATIWGGTQGWPIGTYDVLFDGTGVLQVSGVSNIVPITANHFTFDFTNPGTNVELLIDSSLASNPVHHIRVLMPGALATYQTQPFNPDWLSKLSLFKSVRFMDWGATNGWGQVDPYTWDDPVLFSWNDRADMNHYTWADSKGVPYEMMIKLMNDYNLDGWVCVPHRANTNYMQNMATLFKDSVHTNLKIYVEYSNETWNWMFGQTQWLNKYGCIIPGVSWPEGTVPYVQQCLNHWSTAFNGQLNRLVRVAAVQTGWQDVSNRVCYNLTPGSFDAVGLTYYFNLSTTGDSTLDVLGSAAKASDVAYWARNEMPTVFNYLQSQKTAIADSLHVKMVFYEGGQHLTPIPFGNFPTYCQALEDVQRDSSMYNMYNQWFDALRTLQSGPEPLQLMNFSFVGGLNCQYGSWGILETLNQNTNQIPAPKYEAIKKNQNKNCGGSTSGFNAPLLASSACTLFPNPAFKKFTVNCEAAEIEQIAIVALDGRVLQVKGTNTGTQTVETTALPAGLYVVTVRCKNGSYYKRKLALE